MPGRYVREGFLDSSKVSSLVEIEGPTVESFYFRLYLVVDDYGRFEARSLLLKSKCYPSVENINKEQIVNWLKILLQKELIIVYKVKNKNYLQITNFKQKTRGKSKFPSLEESKNE